ncbi:hypothetical protein SVIOM74S_06103 [Streptomyces violarus]
MTRPVAVHPEDERYQHLIGKLVKLPLTDRSIPVVADEHVDPEFGTGAVKVSPAHDPNDFEIGQRHDLPALTIMDEHAVITAHGPFQGLDRLEARSAIVAALRAEGRIVAEKRPYVHSVGHCSRCKTTIEPRLSMQWWVKVGPLAKAAGDAVRDGRVNDPQEMEKRYFDWVDNLHDWCISRQLWWGHRIQILVRPNGEVVCVGPNTAPHVPSITERISLDRRPHPARAVHRDGPGHRADIAKIYGPPEYRLSFFEVLPGWRTRRPPTRPPTSPRRVRQGRLLGRQNRSTVTSPSSRP